MTSEGFPRQYARTRRFTLGEPRELHWSADGATVYFARSRAGDDPFTCLWAIDVETGAERLICDPSNLSLGENLTAAERARRERLRESAEGITAFNCDATTSTAVFALNGTPCTVNLATAEVHVVPSSGAVFDPQISPDGTRLAMVIDRGCVVADLTSGGDILCSLTPRHDDECWATAEFIAAEEMGRLRGMWWSPDSRYLLITRVDDSPVETWNLSDPALPWAPSRSVRYPAAGTANAAVELFILDIATGQTTSIDWSTGGYEYLAHATWDLYGPLITVQSRDQQQVEVRRVNIETAALETVWSESSEPWVDLVAGTPAMIDATMIVTCVKRNGTQSLAVGKDVVSEPTISVRSVVSAGPLGVLFTANPTHDATVSHLGRWTSADGCTQLTDGDVVTTAVGDVVRHAQRTATLHHPDQQWVLPSGHSIGSVAEAPLVELNVTIRRGRAPEGHELDVAVLLPTGTVDHPLPVLLDPYGGPHALRVVRSMRAHATSQWFADQGFAVVVCDGRGTPGRGTDWEHAVAGNLADVVLNDQIAALDIAAATCARDGVELDLNRVAIRGWSFGGYLAALAVLRRPDRVHAAVAGAPVTDWRWYDTHYTERYLGHPDAQAEAYDLSSLIENLTELTRPLLLIHGLADDNVVAAHTLQLSSALLAVGGPHEVLPLVGFSHMTPQEVVAENLLRHQLEFIERHLAARS